jgi:nudix-type nucleoside diphosphatase (YffH/AdpP family)
MDKEKVKIIDEKTVFDDFFTIRKAKVKTVKPEGGWSEEVTRMSFDRADSVAAVLYLTDKDEVVFTSQFRYPVYGKNGGWLLELVAGTMEEGEEPEITMKREMLEEAGFEVEELTLLSSFFVSPGGTSEKNHVYLCMTSSQKQVQEGGGQDEENEHIELVRLSRDEVERKLQNREFEDAKTIIGLLLSLQQI